MELLKGGLGDIADAYDAIFCDVWGVIHNGAGAFLPACDALRRFRERRGPVILVTNAPVPWQRVVAVFGRVGVPDDCWDVAVAAGDAARSALQARSSLPVLPIGPEGETVLFTGLDIETTSDPEKAGSVCCIGLRRPLHETPEDYREELRRLAARRLPMICANPDVQYRHGDRLIWSAGALAEIYSQEGGEAIHTGKPEAAIYSLGRERLAELTGGDPRKLRILAIGDGPATDIQGAQNEGLDALFIADGIHGARLNDPSRLLADAQTLLEEQGVRARWVMPQLAW